MKITTLLMSAFALIPTAAFADARSDAAELNAFEARESHRAAYTPEAGAARFTAQQNVFVKSALKVDFTYRKATVVLPLYRGVSPTGAAVYYILTDASDYGFAQALGLNYAPKLAKAANGPAAQRVTMDQGLIRFLGNVDFSPVHKGVPGMPREKAFPPKSFTPGATADANWSSVVVLPSGVVANIQLVHNASGSQDRVKALDIARRTVTLSLLDGAQGGKQYYYHLVTEASMQLPASLENGVYSPNLGKVGTFGKDRPSDDSALLGFSPTANGPIQLNSGQEQGFTASLANGGIDPINVFPLPPRNDDSSPDNNYSPLWDAHVTMWTPKAEAEGKKHRILSIDEQKQLIAAGYLTSAGDNPPGPVNAFVGGIRPSQFVVNCPVIAQPDLPPR